MSRGMLCLTTPTHKQKLLSFGIMQAWYYLLSPSFLPSCLCFLSPWKPPHRRFFLDSPTWDITRGWPALSCPLAALKLLTGITPSVLYRSTSLRTAEVTSSLNAGVFCYSRVLSYVVCSSRKNQMQHTSALHSRFKKSKEKITPIHLKLHQVFQVRSSTVDEGHRQISHRPLSQHICLSVPFTSKE